MLEASVEAGVPVVFGGVSTDVNGYRVPIVRLNVASAQSSLLVDMAQTLEITRSADFEETNPLLGPKPSDGAVVAYFGAIAAAHAASYLALEPRWANLVSRVILFVQVPVIDGNARLGVRIAF